MSEYTNISVHVSIAMKAAGSDEPPLLHSTDLVISKVMHTSIESQQICRNKQRVHHPPAEATSVLLAAAAFG